MMKSVLDTALSNARAALLGERNASGHWEGELSTSALSTATAIVALHAVDPEKHAAPIDSGVSLARRESKRGRRLGRHDSEFLEHLDDVAGLLGVESDGGASSC